MTRRAGLDQHTVIETAAKLIDEEGIEQLTLGRLAERLHVRTPSLYNHVAGLTGLKHDLALYCLRELLNRITKAAIGKSKDEAIFAFTDAYLSYAQEYPGRYTLTQIPDLEDKEVQESARQLVEVIAAILAPYKLSEEDTVHAMRSLRTIVHGFLMLEVKGGFHIAVDTTTSLHWLITLFIQGIERISPDVP